LESLPLVRVFSSEGILLGVGGSNPRYQLLLLEPSLSQPVVQLKNELRVQLENEPMTSSTLTSQGCKLVILKVVLQVFFVLPVQLNSSPKAHGMELMHLAFEKEVSLKHIVPLGLIMAPSALQVLWVVLKMQVLLVAY